LKLNYPVINAFIILLFLLQGSYLVVHANTFTTEQQLTKNYNTTLNDFWLQGKLGHFKGIDQASIYYKTFTHDTAQKCLVISSGRSESLLKFRELSYDFFQQGFDIFIVDHRGQGLSQRLLSNPYKGYVKNFDDYADDLHTFINKIVLPSCQNSSVNTAISTPPLYLLSHSMGGAISIRYLQKYPNIFKAVVLSSPMVAFNKGGLPNWLANLVINIGEKLNQWFGDKPWYFIGQQDYQQPKFDNNQLTHSAIRFGYFMDIYQQNPNIQLGGVTVHWLQQAIKTTVNIFADIKKLTSPILVIQAGGDTIVDNQAQNDFCSTLHNINKNSCPNGQAVVIDNAHHELFLESDQYREQALQHALSWFNQHH